MEYEDPFDEDFETNLTVDNLFSNMDEANIDLYTFHVQAPAEAQEAAPAE